MECSHDTEEWKACYRSCQQLRDASENNNRAKQGLSVVARLQHPKYDTTKTERYGVSHTLEHTIRLFHAWIDLLNFKFRATFEDAISLKSIDVTQRFSLPVHCNSHKK